MKTLDETFSDALRQVEEEGGYIALAGGRARNYPSWTTEAGIVRIVPKTGNLSSKCRLVVLGRFLNHTTSGRFRKQAPSWPGFVRFGELAEVLAKYKDRLLPRRPSVPCVAAESASTQAEQLPTQPMPTVTKKRVAYGDLGALVDQFKDELLRMMAEDKSIADIARWLLVQAQDLDVPTTFESLRTRVGQFCREHRRLAGAKLVQMAEESAAAKAAAVVAAPKKVTIPVVTHAIVPAPAAAKGSMREALQLLAGLVDQNEQLQRENDLLRGSLDTIKKALG